MGVDQRRAENYPGLPLPGGFNVLDGYGGQVLSASAKPGLVVGAGFKPAPTVTGLFAAPISYS
jgi:hypothetical protein